MFSIYLIHTEINVGQRRNLSSIDRSSCRIGRLFGWRLGDRKIWPARPSPAGKAGSPCLWPTTASHTRNDVG